MSPADIYILQCPDCRGRIDEAMVCQGCGRVFINRDGILDLMPLRPPMPEFPLHKDKDYLKYNSVQGETDNYFYNNPNPLVNWVQSSGYRAIKRLLGAPAGRILECGCGTGKFLELHVKLPHAQYFMLDIDARSLGKIPHKETLGGVLQGTNYSLPFIDGTFDALISHAQLEHLVYLDQGLLEMKRVLKPSGRLFVSVPNEGGCFWTWGRSMTSARHFGEKLGIDYVKANRIDHFNTVHQIDRALRRHFHVEHRVLGPLPFPSFDYNFTCTYVLTPCTDAKG